MLAPIRILTISKTLMNSMYAIILFFMNLEMSLAEIVIAIPTMPTRECIANYTLSYWLVIVVVLIPFGVLLHGANFSS